jgi:hypothetical protein
MLNRAESDIGSAPRRKLRVLCIDNSLQWYNKDEGCEEAIVELIAARHRKTSDDQQTDGEDTTERERVTIQDARKLITSFHAGRKRGLSYICTGNLRWICSVAVDPENAVGRTPQFSSTSVTVKKCTRV